MKSTKNLLVIIVLSSVQQVMTNQPVAMTLDDQNHILSSMNNIRESVQQLPDHETELMKRGPVKHLYLKPKEPKPDFDYDHDHDHDSHISPSDLETIMR
jgi:hypothetical protein